MASLPFKIGHLLIVTNRQGLIPAACRRATATQVVTTGLVYTSSSPEGYKNVSDATLVRTASNRAQVDGSNP